HQSCFADFQHALLPSRPFLAQHLEGAQRPHLLHVEAVAPGAAVPEVAERARHYAWIKYSCRADALRREIRVEQRRELATQPARDGNAETLLGALQDRLGNVPIEDAAQQVLGAER